MNIVLRSTKKSQLGAISRDLRPKRLEVEKSTTYHSYHSICMAKAALIVAEGKLLLKNPRLQSKWS